MSKHFPRLFSNVFKRFFSSLNLFKTFSFGINSSLYKWKFWQLSKWVSLICSHHHHHSAGYRPPLICAIHNDPAPFASIYGFIVTSFSLVPNIERNLMWKGVSNFDTATAKLHLKSSLCLKHYYASFICRLP